MDKGSGLVNLFSVNGMDFVIDRNVALSCVTVTLILFVVSWSLGRTKIVPTGLQALMEHIWNWLEGLAISQMGPIGKRYVPFCMAIFLYVLVANWIGLIPNLIEMLPKSVLESSPWWEFAAHIFEPATTSVYVTMAMAIISFCAFMVLGIHRSIERATTVSDHGHSHDHDHDHGHDHGHGHSHAEPPGALAGLAQWIGHYIQPVPALWNSMEGGMKYGLVPLLFFLFLFLNIVEELARILSLTFRLFGNIYGEHSVKANLLLLIGSFGTQAITGLTSAAIVPAVGFGVLTLIMWAIVLFVVCLGTLAGFIQAFVFALLTMSYIAHAVADSH